MYGIILDFYWDRGQDPVTVTRRAQTLEGLLSIGAVDPTEDEGNWPRDQVSRLEQIQVRNSGTGGMIRAHACFRRQA